MSHYKPKRFRATKVFGYFFRGIAELLSRWPLLLLVAFLVSPVGPHLRYQYTYEDRGSYRYMLDCEYLGSRGFVRYYANGECPFFVIIDQRKF